MSRVTAGEFEHTASTNSNVEVSTLLAGALSATAGLSVESSTFTFLAASSTVTASPFSTDDISKALKAESVNSALQVLMPTVGFEVSTATVIAPPITPPPQPAAPPPNSQPPLPATPPSIPPPVSNPFADDSVMIVVIVVASTVLGGLALLGGALIRARLRAQTNPRVLPPKAQAAAASKPPSNQPPKDVAVQMDLTTSIASPEVSRDIFEGHGNLRPLSREARIISTDHMSRSLLVPDDESVLETLLVANDESVKTQRVAESVQTIRMPISSGFRHRVPPALDSHEVESTSPAPLNGQEVTPGGCNDAATTNDSLPELPDAIAAASSIPTDSPCAAAAAETELERSLKVEAESKWAQYKARAVPTRKAPDLPVATAQRLTLRHVRAASHPQVLPPNAPRAVRPPTQLAAPDEGRTEHTHTASADLARWMQGSQP